MSNMYQQTMEISKEIDKRRMRSRLAKLMHSSSGQKDSKQPSVFSLNSKTKKEYEAAIKKFEEERQIAEKQIHFDKLKANLQEKLFYI